MDWKIIVLATVIVLLGSVALFGPSSRARGGHDGPEYRVVERDGSVEVREYEGYTTAYVDIPSEFDGAINTGFMKLFNYISGKNTNRSKIKMTVPVTEEQVTGSQKIPMTAPVTSEKISGDVYRVSFIMPANYTLDTLPIPDDKDIKFTRIEPYRAAVIKFPGRMNESLANKKSEELKRWLDKKGLQARPNFIAAQYDPPWIPGFMRRNEVIAEI